jgi:SAM-dependent methyltransferase
MILAQFPEVVFYGRLGDEVLQMFNLAAELPKWRGRRVLDCPFGPGTLPALLRSHGVDVTAVDPLYAMSAAELRSRAAGDLDRTIDLSDLFQSLRPDFDLAGLRAELLRGLEQFLVDFSSHPDTFVAA